MSTTRYRSLLVPGAFLAIYIGWGTTYLANHFLLQELPPFVIAALRFFSAGSLALLWAFASGKGQVQRADGASTLIGGLTLITIGQGALIYANQYLPTGMLAMLYTTLPLWSVALEWLLGERPPLWVLCGLALASAGITLLMSNGLGASAGEDQWFAGTLVVIATLLWAIGAWWMGRRPPFASRWMGIGMQMLLGAVLLGLFGLWRGDWQAQHLLPTTTQGWAWLAYLVLPVSLGVYPAYFWLLREVRPSLVATFAFVNPVVALLLGFLLLDETLSLTSLAACLATLLGVLLIILGRR